MTISRLTQDSHIQSNTAHIVKIATSYVHVMSIDGIHGARDVFAKRKRTGLAGWSRLETEACAR